MESILALATPRQLPSAVQAFRVALTYLWRHGRWPNLDEPRLFTELVQLRKLHDRDPRLPRLADKLLVKDFVARTLGAEWLIPTLWSGAVLPAAPPAPLPLVVKPRHGCNVIAFAFDETAVWSEIKQRADRWFTRTYGLWLDEWLYTRIPPGILVEPFVGEGRTPPIDYKFFVFDGRVAAIQVHLDRRGTHQWVVLDPAYRPFERPSAQIPPPPHSLSAMIAAAEQLAQGFSFVRVDLYEIAGAPRFGELTFYPGSGLHHITPPELDEEWGRLWRDALAPRPLPPY